MVELSKASGAVFENVKFGDKVKHDIYSWTVKVQEFIANAIDYEEKTLIVPKRQYHQVWEDYQLQNGLPLDAVEETKRPEFYFESRGAEAGDSSAERRNSAAQSGSPELLTAHEGGNLSAPLKAMLRRVVNIEGTSGFGPHTLYTTNWFGSSFAVRSEQVLESLTLQYLVQLVTNLDHYGAEIRAGAAKLLLQFVAALSASPSFAEEAEIIREFELLDPGSAKCFEIVQKLFSKLAAPLKDISVPLVATLERFYTFHDPMVRGVCVVAATEFVRAAPSSFTSETERQSALWNLNYALAWLSDSDLVLADRIVMIKACGTMAPLFHNHLRLCLRTAKILLCLPKKTPSEVDALKTSLSAIFSSVALESALKADGIESSFFGLFLEILDTQDEFVCDLLEWAVVSSVQIAIQIAEAPTKTSSNTAIKKEAAQKKDKIMQLLVKFVCALQGSLQAAPPLIRHQAALCLSAALTIYPSLATEWDRLWDFVITGALDVDPFITFVYLSCVSGCHLPIEDVNSDYFSLRSISAMVKLLYQPNNVLQGRPNANDSEPTAPRVTLESVLRETLKAVGKPLQKSALYRMCSSLEYLPKFLRVKQLLLIRLWCERLEEFDSLVVQSMLPLLELLDGETPLAALKVISALAPYLKLAETQDLAYAWSYLKLLLKPRQPRALIVEALAILQPFPQNYFSENKSALAELFVGCHQLTFHEDPSIRREAYLRLIELNTARSKAIMLLSLGDQCLENVQLIIDYLKTFITNSSQLANVERFVKRTLTEQHFPNFSHYKGLEGEQILQVLIFDEFAESLVLKPKGNQQQMVAVPVPNAMETSLSSDIERELNDESLSDVYWTFFLHDVPDTQLAKPDDYSYDRNYVVSPTWVSLLYSKLRVAPPPLRVQNAPARYALPKAPAAKRRLVSAFMICLLPTAGIPEPASRKAACVALVRCCVTAGDKVNTAMLKGLLEFVTQQMLNHRQWTFHASALDILQVLARMRLNGLTPCIMFQYLDVALDMALNTPAQLVRLGALDFLLLLLLMFPNALSSRGSDIRDALRSLLLDDDVPVANRAATLYQFVFAGSLPDYTTEHYKLLEADIKLTQSATALESPAALSDPLLANIGIDKGERVLIASLRAISVLPLSHVSKSATKQAIDSLFRMANFRSHSKVLKEILTTILAIRKQLNPDDSSGDYNIVGWTLMLFFVSTNRGLDPVFFNEYSETPSFVSLMKKAVPPFIDDQPFLSPTTWDQILDDSLPLAVNREMLNNASIPISRFAKLYSSNYVMDGSRQSEKWREWEKLVTRADRLQFGPVFLTGPLPETRVDELLHLLQSAAGAEAKSRSTGSSSLGASCGADAILIMAQLAITVSQSDVSVLNSVLEWTFASLNQEITAGMTYAAETALVALDLLVEKVSGALKWIVQHVNSSQQVWSEGELLAVLNLAPKIVQSFSSKAPEFLRKWLPLLQNQRYPTLSRVYMAKICAEVAAPCTADDISRAIDAVKLFFEAMSAEEADFYRKVLFEILEKLMTYFGTKHPLMKVWLQQAKKQVRSGSESVRQSNLVLLDSISKCLSAEEVSYFAIHLLSDPVPNLRREGIMRLLKQSAFNILIEDSTSSIDLKAMQLGVDKSGDSVKGGLPDRWAAFYAIKSKPAANLPKEDCKSNLLVKQLLDLKFVTSMPTTTFETVKDSKMEPAINTGAALSACCQHYPSVAKETLDTFVNHHCAFRKEVATKILQGGSFSEPEALEQQAYELAVVQELLLALDLMEGTPASVEVLRQSISEFESICVQLRDSILDNLESPFFYDKWHPVPVTSDQQYELMEQHASLLADAKLEVLRTGDGSKLAELDRRRFSLERDVERRADTLQSCYKMLALLWSALGRYYNYSSNISQEELLSWANSLFELLSHEHAGIRRNSIRLLTELYANQSSRHGDLFFFLDSALPAILDELEPQAASANLESSKLYDTLDGINLIGSLALHVKSAPLARRLFWTLVSAWRSPEADVRQASIQMVSYLVECGWPTAKDSFDSQSLASGLLSDTLAINSFGDKSDSGHAKLPDLTREIGCLLVLDQYPEKHLLGNLLQAKLQI